MRNLTIFLVFGIPLSMAFLWAKIIMPLKARQAWKSFAKKMDLTFAHRWIPGDTRLTGIYKGRKVELESFCNEERTRNNSYTSVKLAFKKEFKIPSLSIEVRSVQFFKLLFLKKDAYQVKDDLPKRFEIKSPSRKLIAYIFSSEKLRQALYKALLPKIKRLGEPKITINTRQVLYRQRNCYALQSEQDLKRMLELLNEFAEHIESP